MKIDYSQWTFKISGDWDENVLLQNTITGDIVNVGRLNKFKDGDDPAAIIKLRVKELLLEHCINEQIREWKNKSIPVEDNLDYIENEAQKRGLI